ncbi:malto-oligosyltrehalose trehalohydrolase [Salinimicrobium xinjiangense]|uniref:malto-oligosyltrehalose trehalohydrolase n=1 Tax=Salinimicrobium xinjiangense TaxID=438596 RepID=UPI00048AA6C7|nr:malto-oligosyltrehalose trehalohydrolase [Salinimicrobium xinjiangense]
MNKKIGATLKKDGKCDFCVWAPFAESVELIFKNRTEPQDLSKDEKGYWSGSFSEVSPGTLYKYRLNKKDEFPDPASRSQPDGVHSWSQVIPVDAHDWHDKNWKGRELAEMSIYELHVGTFTPQGTFETIIDKLDHLEELGINTIELMPVAQFPGERNWGYDGVYPFAPQDSYGGVSGLKKLVDACHARNFSILLDVVYNHFGPEGNYISQYGPYFTDKYHTPWGSAINFDDEYSDAVRKHFIQNALMWLEEFHFDGLRLDAIHEIIDRGANHFLRELSEKTDALEQKTGRRYVLIAESDLNDTRLIKDYELGGYGLEGQWVDDFHHSLHTVLTGEKAGYYADFGEMELLAKAFKQAFVYDGTYSVFRKRTVGNNPAGISPDNFVVCIQNHDQVGNRLLGERLAELVSFEKQKLAAATMLSSPFVPMLFMGEEFGEKNRFQYFVSHGDPDLVKAVQEGRKKEFEYFFHSREGEFPDPQAEETFDHSKLNWNFKNDEGKRYLFEFYKILLKLKKEGVFKLFSIKGVQTFTEEDHKILKVSAKDHTGSLTGIFNFGNSIFTEDYSGEKTPEVVISSADKKWGGKITEQELLQEGKLKVPAEAVLIYSS